MIAKGINGPLDFLGLRKTSTRARVTFSTILLFAASNIFAQLAVPPPAPPAVIRSSPELDTLVGPIALYPDPLIAQILPAATLPTQIVLAERFLGAGNNIDLVDQQPWDQSVKAVARYPDLLKMLDGNLDWTTQLGQAFLYQPQDVMNAIQRLRSQALSLGNLQTTPQQQVVSDAGIIEVLPADPAIVYVPVYEPSFVFFRPHPLNGFYISFGRGFRIGAWLNHDVDWYHHNVIVWGPGHERPSGWWREPPHERFRDVRVVNNYRVWQPGPHEIRGDRGWDTRAEHRPVAPPPREIARPLERPGIPPRAVETHPRPASGALIGVSSARSTEQFSRRGAESRQISRPPTAPSRPAQGEHQQGRK